MTTIYFNGKSFEIPEAALGAASGALRNHLSSVMNGTGATVNFGGTAYNIDSTKLSTATNAFVSHLGTVAGSGYRVKVGNVEYGVDSGKMTGAVSEIEAVLAGLNNPDAPSTGDEILEGDGQEFHKFAPTALTFRSTAPLNELQEVQINGVTVDPSNYTLEEGSTIVTLPIEYLNTLDVDNYEITVVSDSKSAKGGFTVVQPELNEHGFYYNQPYSGYAQGYGDIVLFYRENNILDFMLLDTGYIENATYTVNGNTITNNVSLGAIPATISNDATIQCAALSATFKLDDAIVADEDFIYILDSHMYDYVTYEGYHVAFVIDKEKSVYSSIRTGINGTPTILVSGDLFQDCVNMIIAPEIPDTVLYISSDMFYNCTKLESIIIPSNIKFIGATAFYNCTNLSNITFKGTIEQWSAMTKGNHWNEGVPATHVQCTDGQVAL